MRILYTHRTQAVGAEGAHIRGMVEAFGDLGHQVVLDGLAGGETDAAPRGLLASVARHAPQLVFGWIEVAYNLPLALRLTWRLLRHRPDLVYERYSLCTFAPALLCRALGVPHVLEINDSVVIERSRPLKLRRIARFCEGRVLAWTRLIVTISDQFKRQLLEAFPADPRKILVCPNAVSERTFLARGRASESRLAALRERYRVRGTAVVGSAGQFVPWHGLVPFVEAVASLVRERDLFLLFIGDGPVRDETLAAARRLGVEDRIAFTGMIPHAEIPDHLDLLDVAIVPHSNVHGSPMKLMEFMARGLPAIAPDVPPVREVLEDGRTGRTFPAGDGAALARCLVQLLDEPERARRLGATARAHVATRLTWTVHARSVLERLQPRT